MPQTSTGAGAPSGHPPPGTPAWLASSRDALRIRDGEGRRVGLLFAQLLACSALFVLGRTVRDTLFLSRYPLDALPWMFVCYGVASAATVVIYARVVDRLPRERMMIAWCALGVLTYVGTWVAVHAGVRAVYPAFYVWSEVFANLLVSQFWTLANDLFDPRAGKRLFGTVGAARILGIIVVGLATGAAVRALGTELLLFVLAALCLVVAGLAAALGREPRAAKATGERPTRARRAGAPSVLRDDYVRPLAVMMLFCFAALTLGDYQFKAIARATYHEDELARFFSYFYATAGLAGLAFQLFVTPRLLGRFGVGAGMLVMPTAFGLGTLALLGAPILPVASALKFADNGFQYTVHETTLQSLYVPFPAAAKARTRAFLDAVAKPLAYGLGGVLLLLFAGPLGTAGLSWVAAACVVGWLAVIPWARRRYLARLEATLSARPLEDDEADVLLDASARALLVATLAAPDRRLALAALDSLGPAAPADARDACLGRLLAAPEASLRCAALERCAALPAGPRASRGAEAALGDEDSAVRAAAARAVSAQLGEDAIERLRPLLDDTAREVRTAALTGVLAHGGFEGAMVAGTRLATLLASARDDDREDAARAVAGLGRGGHRRLEALLGDPSPAVRRAAVRAAVDVAHPHLLPALLERLAEPRLAGDASSALAAIGPGAIAPLASALADPATPRAVRLALPRVLRGIRDPRAYDALRARLDDPDSHLRLRTYAALSRLRIALGRPPEPLDDVTRWVLRERDETETLVASWAGARDALGTPLLEESIAFRAARGVKRVLRALELRHSPESLRLVREHLDDERRRPHALEVLDTLLEPSLRGLVLPFVDAPPDAPLRAGVTPLDTPAFVRASLAHPNPFVVFVTLDALRAHAHPEARAAGAALLAHPDPLVREAAALAALDGRTPDDLAHLATLSHDPDAQVAHVARALAAAARGAPSEEPMHTTVEKLLALRSAPLFAKLRAEDLAPLARIAEVERADRGEVVFAEGEHGDALYVVVRGAVDISHGPGTLAHLGPGEAFGEMAVLDAGPRSATARAAIDGTEVLRIDSEAFYEVLREQVEIAEGVIRMLSARLREANEALESARGA